MHGLTEDEVNTISQLSTSKTITELKSMPIFKQIQSRIASSQLNINSIEENEQNNITLEEELSIINEFNEIAKLEGLN